MSRTIVITGASSGIGKALALRYAPTDVTLGLLGRNGERLERVAADCRAAGAKVETGLIDVRAREEMAAWLETFDSASPVDLLIANAGVMEGTPPGGDIELPQPSYELMQINVLGVLNTVQPLLPRMMARRRGQIAVISSLAGLIPLRDSPSYCASKSALLTYGLSLRDLLRAHGIGVSVVCPGFVTTPMSQQEIGDKPFEMPPARAVDIIMRGLQRNKAVIAFPFWFALAARVGGLLPHQLRERITRGSRFRVNPAASRK
ncbi:MAG: SDR family NAD(P)-dependent oxidoreductase [Pseudolabrys sp.]